MPGTASAKWAHAVGFVVPPVGKGFIAHRTIDGIATIFDALENASNVAINIGDDRGISVRLGHWDAEFTGNRWGDKRFPLTEIWYDTIVTPEHFQTAIRGFQRRTPFKPYVVELVSGDRVQVDHPEALVLRGGVGVFLSATGAPSIFDHEGVSQIFAESGESAAA
jgi:hypothetical protein